MQTRWLTPWKEALSSLKGVAQSSPALCDPMDCSLPGSSVHGIPQARTLEWTAIPFSRGSSQPRDWTQVFCTAGGFFKVWATREAQAFWGGILSLSFLPFPWWWRIGVGNSVGQGWGWGEVDHKGLGFQEGEAAKVRNLVNQSKFVCHWGQTKGNLRVWSRESFFAGPCMQTRWLTPWKEALSSLKCFGKAF